jgi:hypothetical protein
LAHGYFPIGKYRDFSAWIKAKFPDREISPRKRDFGRKIPRSGNGQAGPGASWRVGIKQLIRSNPIEVILFDN